MERPKAAVAAEPVLNSWEFSQRAQCDSASVPEECVRDFSGSISDAHLADLV